MYSVQLEDAVATVLLVCNRLRGGGRGPCAHVPVEVHLLVCGMLCNADFRTRKTKNACDEWRA